MNAIGGGERQPGLSHVTGGVLSGKNHGPECRTFKKNESLVIRAAMPDQIIHLFEIIR